MAEKGRQFALGLLSVDHMIDGWASVLSNLGSLPPKPVGTRPPYSEPATARGWLEHWMRHFLRRPYHHANAHGEWPWYRPGYASVEEQTRWVDGLNHLESELQSLPETPSQSTDPGEMQCFAPDHLRNQIKDLLGVKLTSDRCREPTSV